MTESRGKGRYVLLEVLREAALAHRFLPTAGLKTGGKRFLEENGSWNPGLWNPGLFDPDQDRRMSPNATCRDEKHQIELLQRFAAEGLECTALLS